MTFEILLFINQILMWRFSEATCRQQVVLRYDKEKIELIIILKVAVNWGYIFRFKQTSVEHNIVSIFIETDQTSGDSIDWVYGRLGVVHSYGVELRPNLSHRRGFRYHPRATVPTGEDLLLGILTIANELLRDANSHHKGVKI